jgi:NADH-quinone oxidoreductase subunit F
MVDIARYFLEFTQDESCGKCTFCRVGTCRMLEILERFCAGEASRRDLSDLEELCERVRNTSLCGLGSTAPNPILTTLRYFRHEYEAHLDGHCPAGKCTALIKFEINDKCIGCTLCAQACPTNAIDLRPHELHEIDQEKCVQCGSCRNVCPVDAVDVE